MHAYMLTHTHTHTYICMYVQQGRIGTENPRGGCSGRKIDIKTKSPFPSRVGHVASDSVISLAARVPDVNGTFVLWYSAPHPVPRPGARGNRANARQILLYLAALEIIAEEGLF
jgi:hypothetical protein